MKLPAPQKKKKSKTLKIKSSSPFLAPPAPTQFYIPKIRWNEREIKIINWLQNRYGFAPDFNLPEHLAYVDMSINSHLQFQQFSLSANQTYQQLNQQFPSHEDVTHDLKVLKKQMQIVKSIFEPFVKKLNSEKKIEFTNLLDMLYIMSGHRSTLVRASAGGFKTLDDIQNSLELLIKNDFFIKLLANLDKEITDLRIPEREQHTPKRKSKRGRKKSEEEGRIIHALLDTYEEGTHQKPICNYHPINGGFSGEFYFFLFGALSLLRKKISIKPLKPETWGDYARKIIRSRR